MLYTLVETNWLDFIYFVLCIMWKSKFKWYYHFQSIINNPCHNSNPNNKYAEEKSPINTFHYFICIWKRHIMNLDYSCTISMSFNFVFSINAKANTKDSSREFVHNKQWNMHEEEDIQVQ